MRDCAREQQKFNTGKCKITQLAKELYLLQKISHLVTQFNENTSSIAIIKQMKQNCSERTKRAKTKIQFYCMNPQCTHRCSNVCNHASPCQKTQSKTRNMLLGPLSLERETTQDRKDKYRIIGDMEKINKAQLFSKCKH